MSAELIGGLVDAAIPVLAGLFATGYGWGRFGGATTKAPKARQLLGVLGPLLVVYGLVMITLAFVQDRNRSGEGRAMFVAAANSRAGDAVDEETLLVSVTDAGAHIQFDYKLHRVTRDMVDPKALAGALRTNMVAYLCGTDTANQALAAWGPFVMRYVDSAETEITALSMTADECP